MSQEQECWRHEIETDGTRIRFEFEAVEDEILWTRITFTGEHGDLVYEGNLNLERS